MALERIRQLNANLTSASSGLAALETKNADDVVITMAVRYASGSGTSEWKSEQDKMGD